MFHPTWPQAMEALADDPGVAVVLGGSDTGKTTWVASAARQLGRAGQWPLAIVDGDIGQSTIGPPATVALSVLKETRHLEGSLSFLPSHAFSFVGSVSPIGHLLQLLVATTRLVEKAVRSGARTVLIDTTGLIDDGAGFQLKLRKIELVGPRHLIALQREKELEAILSVVRERPGLRIHRLAVSPSARSRSPAERSAYRAQCFAAYFAKAKRLALESSRLCMLTPPTGRFRLRAGCVQPLLEPSVLCAEDLTGLLVGLNDPTNETLGLGLLEGASQDGRAIFVLTPLADAAPIRILQMGNLRLDQSGKEV
ncbi:MAG: hypothetical protein HY581_01355 [Nitrospirae bacterium]|nr:hypothetical protein [Nitrospirota bacterium]